MNRPKYKLILFLVTGLMIFSGCQAKPQDIPIDETISISVSKAEYQVNETEALKLYLNSESEYFPNDAICQSSNSSVVFVVNNKIFALLPGSAKINCSLSETISNTITLQVKKIEPPLILEGTSSEIVNQDNTDHTDNPSIPVNENSGNTENIPGKLLQVSFIDVGQGDSTLIQTPNGQIILIDAGTSSSKLDLKNYLVSKGIEKIDVLVATHPHADHIGGMSYIIDNFIIGKIYMPNITTTTVTFENLLTTIKSHGLTINSAKSGILIPLDPSIVLQMIAPIGSGYGDLNQHSAVILLKYNKNTFLFMGDAGKESEQEIIQSGINLKADVLKVGHHGSSTSSSNEFLKKVLPKIAVISVGVDNSYGHPNQETLNRFMDINSLIYRTDLNGTIIITSDGMNVTVD